MPADQKKRTVRLALPEPARNRAERQAARRHRSLEDHIECAAKRAVETENEAQTLLEEVSRSYRAQRPRAGKRGQSAEERLEELRKLREQAASDLYP